MWLVLASAHAIVGGEEVPAGDFPAMVHVAYPEYGRGCTGSLVAPSWVLTSAHCVDEMTDLATVRVGFGDAVGDLREVTVVEAIPHPRWPGRPEPGVDTDMALLRLTEPVTDVDPIAVRSPTAADVGRDAILVGYGLTRFQGTESGPKRRVDVPIVAVEDGRVETFDGEGSTCLGDQGGLLLVDDASRLVGIAVSAATVGCGDGPSIASALDDLDWLAGAIRPEQLTVAVAPLAVECTPDALGVVPLEVRCVLARNGTVARAVWSWGDGGEDLGSELAASHTYTAVGRFPLEVCAEGEGPDGHWEECAQPERAPIACVTPKPAFDVVPGQGLEVQFENLTLVAVPECLAEIAWNVFPEGEREPIATLGGWTPRFTFPEPGRYEVVMNVGGVAGSEAARLSFRVRDNARSGCDGSGCDQSGGSSVGGFLLALVAVRGRCWSGSRRVPPTAGSGS